jgi:hypothetical protein
MEEEVKIAKMDIHVKTAEPEVGIEPLVIVQVEIIEIIVKEHNVYNVVEHFIFSPFSKDFGDEIQNTKGVMSRGLDDYMILDE